MLQWHIACGIAKDNWRTSVVALAWNYNTITSSPTVAEPTEESDTMLTIQDCLDYCDLTDDEVDLFAAHEHIPREIASPIICSLVQTDEGVQLVCACLTDIVQSAVSSGELDQAEHVLHVYAEFRSTHPLTH
jgi:hypothetical protein